MSTPASPTPFTDDGEDLLVELRGFVSSAASSSSSLQVAQAALRLLKHLPATRDAVLDYFASSIDASVSRDLEELASGALLDKPHISSLNSQLKLTLGDFLRGPTGAAWAPLIAEWALNLLGDLSSKYAKQVAAGGDIHKTLALWLSTDGGSMLVHLTSECMGALQDDHQTEACVASLLDASVRHGPNFDWVVAHIGGCFPQTVIARVLSVGRKDFAASVAKKQYNFAAVPKINSVVGILGHLGATHGPQVNAAVRAMLAESLLQQEEMQSDLEEATVPYLLNLASMDGMLASCLNKCACDLINYDVADTLSAMEPVWSSKYFAANDTLLNLVVSLIAIQGTFELMKLLLELSVQSGDVGQGCKLLLDHWLADLQASVHQTPKYKKESFVPLLREAAQHLPMITDRYLMHGADGQQKKTAHMLATLTFVQEGQSHAVAVISQCLCTARTESQLSTVIQLVKDSETWLPGVLQSAVHQSLGRRSKMHDVLDNLGSILHYESQNVASISKFSEATRHCYELILPLLEVKECIPRVLKVLHFVPFPANLEVSLMHKAAGCLVHALFVAIDDDNADHMFGIYDILADISGTSPIGLPIVLRCLLEGAVLSPFARLFGGKSESRKLVKDHRQLQSSLYEENLKFGSMPTHPLGTSTVFHAGVIGEGKLKRAKLDLLDVKLQGVQQRNCFLYVSLLFKLCDKLGEGGESYKQLALLIVDLVSPDVMYNGLPWPDEDFTRVTMERDLHIAKVLDDHPILWKILWGLAEARPALCYCSVVLRGALAVYMALWAASHSSSAGHRIPLENTRNILQLMSVGQFLPPPLDAASEILHVVHPFHVHCVLVDIWNYVRDNVPSPVAFVANENGTMYREFEPYANYKTYCERLRLIMIQHIAHVPNEYKKFFVDVVKSES